MAEPTFSRSGDGPLYLLDGAPELGEYRVAFLPDDGAAAPAALTLAQTWRERSGVHLFLGEPPADDGAFAARLRRYLAEDAFRHTRFLFLANPGDLANRWRTSRLAVRPAGEGFVTAGVEAFDFRSVSLFVGAGLPVALSAAGDGFEIAAGGGVHLASRRGGFRPGTAGEVLTLTFAGEAAGTFACELRLAAGELEKLPSGLRYFFDDAFPGFLDTRRFPVFEPQAVTVHPRLDPLHPFHRGRTFFAFLADGESRGAPLASYYRTPLGQPVTLAPARTEAGPAKLVLARRRRRRVADDGADPVYLTLEGAFAVGYPSTPERRGLAPDERLMCGVSGVEYLEAREGDLLHFVPGRDAYAPPRPSLVEEGAADGAEAPPLTGLATTSWSYATPGGPGAGGVLYFSQPDEANLFERTAAGGALLEFMPVPAGHLPVAPPEPGAFPMVAHAGDRGASLEPFRELERAALSPLRRAVLAEILEPPRTGGGAEGERLGATPQGLLASFDASFAEWRSLVVASTPPRPGEARRDFTIRGVAGALREALLSSQLFLVASSADKFAEAGSIADGEDQVFIRAWTFNLGLDDWRKRGTILIFKFFEGRLDELARDPAFWTQAAAFNDDVAATRRRLAEILDDARDREGSDFAFFNEIVTDERWNGVLALDVEVPLDGLPAEIAGLAAGLDPAKFFAHHVGLHVNPIRPGTEVLETDESSLFGLINYVNPKDLAGLGDYDFKVLELKVLFRNSLIRDFASRIEILVNRLFGESSSLPTGDRGNNLVLDGVYQRHAEKPAYVFQRRRRDVFQVVSQVIEDVEFEQVHFVTTVPASGAGGETTEARFLFRGTLRLLELTGLDLFSFGSAFGEDRRERTFEGGLAFVDLAVDLTFPRADPAAKTMRFNAAGIRFDMARSAPRPASLFRNFPLKLARFLQVEEGGTPQDLGYLAVGAPLPLARLEPPWFGFVFDLSLGTPGALAASVDFTATLLAAWAPAGEELAVDVGLTLPGAGGGDKSLSLQGVLKLSVRGIELTVAGETAYLLRLKDIKLRLLSLSFPPAGQTTVQLFGNPDPQASNESLGWYAAYANPRR